MVDRPPLSAKLLIYAYSNGYFPMPHPDTGEIGWYRPDPRAVIPLDSFHVSRSLHKTIKQNKFSASINQNFVNVMKECSARPDTWITADFIAAYSELHRRGFAHSIEIWKDGGLAGGVYGVAINGAFFAESMFHAATDASKVALFHLVDHMKAQGMMLLEVQFMTPHLKSLGAIEVSDQAYMKNLEAALAVKANFAGAAGQSDNSETDDQELKE